MRPIHKKTGDSLKSPVLWSRSLGRNACPLVQRPNLLLAGTCIGGCGRAPSRLRHAQVASGRSLADPVDDQFHRLAGSARVEENGFVNRTILLFKTLVIGQ